MRLAEHSRIVDGNNLEETIKCDKPNALRSALYQIKTAFAYTPLHPFG